MIDWTLWRDRYLSTGLTLPEIAQEAGAHVSTVRRVAARDGWVADRAKLRAAAAAAGDVDIVDEVAGRTQKLYAATDRLLDRLVQEIDNASFAPNSRSLRDITGALKDIKDILGIKNNGDIREQEARIAKLEKEVSGTDDKVIRVVMSDGTEELAE